MSVFEMVSKLSQNNCPSPVIFIVAAAVVVVDNIVSIFHMGSTDNDDDDDDIMVAVETATAGNTLLPVVPLEVNVLLL